MSIRMSNAGMATVLMSWLHSKICIRPHEAFSPIPHGRIQQGWDLVQMLLDAQLQADPGPWATLGHVSQSTCVCCVNGCQRFARDGSGDRESEMGSQLFEVCLLACRECDATCSGHGPPCCCSWHALLYRYCLLTRSITHLLTHCLPPLALLSCMPGCHMPGCKDLAHKA